MSIARVLLDTNVLISYLLTKRTDSPVIQVVEAGVRGVYTLLLPQDLADELQSRARAKRYLAEHVSPEQVQALVNLVAEVAEAIPRIAGAIPQVARDRGDDYLLAYALVGRADYLVTGDQDLLVLEQVAETRIVSVAAFAELCPG